MDLQPNDEPMLLTIPEAAQTLRIGRTLVYELISAGELEVVHIGRASRVPLEAIRDFVAARRAEAALCDRRYPQGTATGSSILEAGSTTSRCVLPGEDCAARARSPLRERDRG